MLKKLKSLVKMPNREERNNEKIVKKMKVPRGYFPIYVGEKRERCIIPIKYLGSIMLQALLNQFEDENQTSGQPIRLSCSREMFEWVCNLIKEDDWPTKTYDPMLFNQSSLV